MRLTPKKATKSSKLTPQSSKKVQISLEQPKETFPEVSKGSSLEFIKF